MDKYIKMMLIKLSEKYKATVTSIMFYDAEKQRIKTVVKLRIAHKGSNEAIAECSCYNKRELVGEMMKWLN